jgi:hypothetical protein
MTRQDIEVEGWTAVPIGHADDWYIYDRRGAPRGFRGLARSEQAARQWLDESTGSRYARLPAVTLADLQVQVGPKTPGEGRGSWYRHTVYLLQGEEVGRVQDRWVRCPSLARGGRIETLTLHGERCVQGCNVRWMLQEAGYRLEPVAGG